jgi:hypothetical protein
LSNDVLNVENTLSVTYTNGFINVSDYGGAYYYSGQTNERPVFTALIDAGQTKVWNDGTKWIIWASAAELATNLNNSSTVPLSGWYYGDSGFGPNGDPVPYGNVSYIPTYNAVTNRALATVGGLYTIGTNETLYIRRD